jgi:hypothetical protein
VEWLGMEHRWVKRSSLAAKDVEDGRHTHSPQPRPFPEIYRPDGEGHALAPLPLPNSLPALLNFPSFCTDPLRGKLRRDRPPGRSQGEICQGFGEGTFRISPVSVHVFFICLLVFGCLCGWLRRGLM